MNEQDEALNLARRIIAEPDGINPDSILLANALLREAEARQQDAKRLDHLGDPLKWAGLQLSVRQHSDGCSYTCKIKEHSGPDLRTVIDANFRS
jgi:hypothetical protein